MRTQIIPRTRRGLLVRIAILLIVVCTLFEMGIRLLPPDAVHYNVQFFPYAYGSAPFSKIGTITDPATVAQWRAAMTATPNGRFIWQTSDNCAESSDLNATYVFLWHGLPIEVVTTLPSCTGGYEVSSGGITDPRAYQIDLLITP